MIQRPLRYPTPARGGVLAPVLIVLLALLLGVIFPPLARDVVARELSWERYDVTIDVHEDGSFTVHENQVIDFTDGVFTQGYATIPLSRIEDIDDIRVFEDGMAYERGNGAPGTYTASIVGGEVEILWWFDPAVDETRNFTITYDVEGGLRVYEDEETGNLREQLWWRAIDEDFAADIQSATVTVNLPEPVPQDDLSLAWYTTGNADVAYEVLNSTTARFVADDIEQGDALEVRLEFPKITAAVEPVWQAADDARRAQEERLAPFKALANVLMLGVGALLLIGGTIGVYLLWHLRGRDTPVVLPIDLLREPPDDLPAAAVGTLIDEHANDHDVIAGIVELGERGIIQIEEQEPETVFGLFGLGNRDFVIRRVDREQPLEPYERELLAAIFGSKDEVRLSRIKERFAERQARVKSAIYEALVRQGYFPHSPQGVRSVYRGIGMSLLVASVVGGVFLFSAIGAFAPLVVVPIVAAAIASLFLMAFGGAMPRKTPKGAEAAARWLAFRRYLAEIERYENVAEAREIFHKYLPYAVAFGLERSWVRKFARVDTPAPRWYGPSGGWTTGRRTARTGRLPRTSRGPVVIAPGGGGWDGDVDIPDMQDMSDAAGRSLQDMSDGLFDLFNEASKAFQMPSKGGGSSRSGGFGGFSGGGGGFGGGGGGGGRGFR